MPSLLEALKKKYFSDCDFESDNGDVSEAEKIIISIFIPRLSPLLSVPELLVLNDCDIDCAGDLETIKDKCQRVRELDLAQNKLRDWNEVFQILKHTPRIEFVNLSKNNLSGPMPNLDIQKIASLKSIVLNGTYLDWPGVAVLLENLPILDELHLSLNNYKEVLIDTVQYKNDSEDCETHNCSESPTSIKTKTKRFKEISTHNALKTLHFTGNPIESWEEICRLGRVFPSLESLVLADCPIKTIQVNKSILSAEDFTTPPNRENHSYKCFQNLRFLNLSYTDISTWIDVDLLSSFPKLQNLRIKDWPLWERLECTEHERRQLLIARLPNIMLLNGGGVITADEREDAERAFIRYYVDKPEYERPRCYATLLDKHGKLDPLVNVNLKIDKRVKILLTFNEKTEERFVDIYRTVSDLKMQLEKTTHLPANKLRLFYLDKDYKEFGPEEMKYPNKFLFSYNIQTGDEIIVDEKKLFCE